MTSRREASRRSAGIWAIADSGSEYPKAVRSTGRVYMSPAAPRGRRGDRQSFGEAHDLAQQVKKEER
jgi:hypothetical protein